MYQCGFVVDKATLELVFFQVLNFPLPVYLSVHHAPYLPVIRNWYSRAICGCSTKGLVFITLLQVNTEQHSSSVCSKTFLTNKG